ncbi:MAG TPA: putative addiction module antidote protein [Elusimicrobiales bacterium]|nr:putative addiction module antidote protein [Elusimicrobiales bacterium]
MRRTISHRSYLRKQLSRPEEAAAYLNSVIEDNDTGALLKAIRNVANAHGGIGALAKAAKMSRTSLYKTLSPTGNPEISTLETILAVYGIRIGFFAVRPETNARNHSNCGSHGFYGRPSV